MPWWYLLAVVGFLFLLRHMWRAYSHPYNLLVRQAANMEWIASGSIKYPDGIKNMRLRRDDMVAEVSFKNVNVKLLQPDIERPFKDFLEVEQWLGSLKAANQNLSIKASRTDSKKSSKEVEYFDRVSRLLAAKGAREKFTTLQGWDKDFGVASTRLCVAADLAKENPTLIAAFILESMDHYHKNRDIALSYLARLESGYKAMAADPKMAGAMLAEVETESEVGDFHEALDFLSGLAFDFIEESGLLDIFPEPDESARLYAEQLTYLAACKARTDLKKNIHPSLWNTFKVGIENRMLAIRDDKSPRSGVLNTPDGQVFASLASSHWQRLDGLEKTLKNGGVDGLVKRLTSEMDATHWKDELLADFFNEFSVLTASTLLPKIENMLD